jgi:hypothetical protein
MKLRNSGQAQPVMHVVTYLQRRVVLRSGTCQSREASGEDPMTIERSQWPLLVRIGLVRITNRTMAWLFALGSLMISIVFLAMKAFVAGGAFFLAACWYLWVIRWVNRHGHWS